MRYQAISNQGVYKPTPFPRSSLQKFSAPLTTFKFVTLLFGYYYYTNIFMAIHQQEFPNAYS